MNGLAVTATIASLASLLLGLRMGWVEWQALAAMLIPVAALVAGWHLGRRHERRYWWPW